MPNRLRRARKISAAPDAIDAIGAAHALYGF
jgi:hypothetical protein